MFLRNLLRGIVGLSLIAALTACLYRPDVRQGNYITPEMLARLQLGMTQDEVRFVMGTPLLMDPFHANRWDYIYTFAPSGRVQQQGQVSLLFKDGKLSKIDGDATPNPVKTGT